MIYSPSDDSYLLEEQVKKHAKNKSVLDIGSGSGIQSLAALNSKAKSVTASDISQEAIKSLKNKLKNENIKIIKSDLFQNIKGKFDLIIFNPPYLPQDEREDRESSLSTSGGKKGDEIILKFLKKARSYLKKNGAILLVVSSLTPTKRIKKLLKKLGLKKTKLSGKKLFFEKLEVWSIKIIHYNNNP